MSLAACAALLLALFVYIFWPSKTLAAQREKTRLDYLGERKEVVYENLRDLNFENRAGKFSDEDYAAQRTLLEDEAATVIAEMDRLEGGTPVRR